jgi:hypothetical protein
MLLCEWEELIVPKVHSLLVHWYLVTLKNVGNNDEGHTIT